MRRSFVDLEVDQLRWFLLSSRQFLFHFPPEVVLRHFARFVQPCCTIEVLTVTARDFCPTLILRPSHFFQIPSAPAVEGARGSTLGSTPSSSIPEGLQENRQATFGVSGCQYCSALTSKSIAYINIQYLRNMRQEMALNSDQTLSHQGMMQD